MTTSLAEYISSVLKGISNLPITASVKLAYFRMTELYVTKSVQAQAQIALSQMFSEALIKII